MSCEERIISEKSQFNSGRLTSDLQTTDVAHLDYVLDLRTVLVTVVKWSWIIIIFTGIGAFYGVKDSANFVPKHTAKMVIATQKNQGSIGGNAPRGRDGNLTSTIMQALGTRGEKSDLMLQRIRYILKSRQLAIRLDEKFNLSREVFASRWDSKKGTWKTVTKAEPTLRDRLDIYLHQNQPRLSGPEALAIAVGNLVQITKIKKTEFWEVSLSHVDRDTALRWLRIIFKSADQLLREQDRQKMKEQIRFLRSRTEKAQLAGFRAALFGALIQQEKNLHLIDSDLPYSAHIVEPAFASEIRTMPNLMKTIGLPTLVAGFIGLLIVLLISVFVKE